MNDIIKQSNQLLEVDLILRKSFLCEKMKVVDLGCGTTGDFIFKPLEIVGKNGIVFAVDIIKENLLKIRKTLKERKISNVKLIWSDLEYYGAAKIDPLSIDVERICALA